MTNEEWYNQLTTEEKNILKLVKDKSTSTKKLEEIVAKYPLEDWDENAYVEELVEWLSYHPNSSANILDKISVLGEYSYSIEIANHPNTSIKTLKALCYDDDYSVVEDAKKQLKKRGVKTKKHPLRGKDVYVVMHSHSDGCDSYVYAEEKHADAKEAQLERKLEREDGCVWIEVQEIQ